MDRWILLIFAIGVMGQNEIQQESPYELKNVSNKALTCLWLQIERWTEVRLDPAFRIYDKPVQTQHKRKVKAMMAENCLKKIPEEVSNNIFAQVDYNIINETLYPYIDVDLKETTKEGFNWELTETEIEASAILKDVEKKMEEMIEEEQDQIQRAEKFRGLFEEPIVNLCSLLAQSYATNDSKLIFKYVNEDRSFSQVRRKILGMGIVSCISEIRKYSKDNIQEMNITKVGEQIFDDSVFTNSSFSWTLSKIEGDFANGVELLEKYPQEVSEETAPETSDPSLMKTMMDLFVSSIPSDLLPEDNPDSTEEIPDVEALERELERQAKELDEEDQAEQKTDL